MGKNQEALRSQAGTVDHNFVTGLVEFSPIFVYEIAYFISTNFSNNHYFIQLTLFASKKDLERSTLNLMIYF